MRHVRNYRRISRQFCRRLWGTGQRTQLSPTVLLCRFRCCNRKQFVNFPPETQPSESLERAYQFANTHTLTLVQATRTQANEYASVHGSFPPYMKSSLTTDLSLLSGKLKYVNSQSLLPGSGQFQIYEQSCVINHFEVPDISGGAHDN